LTEEQRRDATQIRDFTTGVKPFGAPAARTRKNGMREVEATLLSACLDRVLAKIEVAFSNSTIEAFWRSPKH
jgi:hypothetical protein